MYKAEYVCDYCGKIINNDLIFILNLSSKFDAPAQDQFCWHYCEKCWPKVKEMLKGKSDSEELKKENEKLKKDAQWYENFFNLMWKAFAESFYGKNWTENTGYGFTTITTTSSNEGKTIQAKPIGDEPFITGCRCENTNKDSLNYKQTTAPYSSLK